MRIYLDYDATTPVDRAVLGREGAYFSERSAMLGPSISAGQKARGAVDAARESVAALLGAKSSEIVFTSGGTKQTIWRFWSGGEQQ